LGVAWFLNLIRGVTRFVASPLPSNGSGFFSDVVDLSLTAQPRQYYETLLQSRLFLLDINVTGCCTAVAAERRAVLHTFLCAA